MVTVELEPEGVADGDHQLASPQQLGIPERRRRHRQGSIDAHQRQVGVGIVADDARRQLAPFHRRHLHPCAAADDVAVGQHQPVGCDHHARAGATAPSRAARRLHVEPHHCRTHAVDDIDDGAGIGIQERLVLHWNHRRIRGIEVWAVEHGT